MAELADAETQSVHAVEVGTVLDLADAPDRCIRGWVIRDVLRSVLASHLCPRGMRVREALVEGDCDVDDVRTTLPVELESCVFTGSIQLIEHTWVRSTGPAAAWYLNCEHDVSLTWVRCAEGLELAHARIGGQLSLTDAVLASGTGPALNAHNAGIDGDILIDDCRLHGHSEHATVSPIEATVGRDLRFSDATVVNLSEGMAAREIVTFRLDEQLGFGLVPTTSVDGHGGPGSMQAWRTH